LVCSGTGLELRAIVVNLVPGGLGADKDMKARLLGRYVIEDPQSQIDLAAAVLLAKEAGAALAAEGEGGLRGFLVTAYRLFPSGDGDFVAIQPADRGVVGAGKFAALRAVAVTHVIKLVWQVQMNGATEATGV